MEDNIFISRTLKVHNLMTKNTDDPINFFMKIKFMKEILLCTKLVQWRIILCCLFVYLFVCLFVRVIQVTKSKAEQLYLK